MNVKELRELLGDDVVLLHCKPRTKIPLGKWGELTVADMTPAYFQKLERGNIGVALGAKSGNLVALDVDNDEMIQPFLTANPFLIDTLQTHGARGRVFWLRMSGGYPARTVKLKTNSGIDCGEWRAGTNSQSIIHGTHPDGNVYEIVNKAKPVSADFASIVWPSEIINPPKANLQYPASNTEGQRDRVTETQKSPMSLCLSVCSGSLSSPSLCNKVKSIEHAVELALPSKNRQNHERLFTLARAVKSLEIQSGKFTPKHLREVFNEWFKRASEFLKPEQTRDNYMAEFMNAYASAKIPLGEGAVTEAWKLAQENPLPPEAVEMFEDDKMRLTVALCRELQNIAGVEPFYLSARTLQGLLNLDSHNTAARWLRSLCVLKILDEIEKGGGFKASRYRYITVAQAARTLKIPIRKPKTAPSGNSSTE